MKFGIKRKELKAVLRFAAKKDIRYYLQAVCVKQGPFGTILTATNGHMLAVFQADKMPQPEGEAILPRAALEPLQGVKKQREDWLHFEIIGANVEVLAGDESRKFSTVQDAKFPDIFRVIPDLPMGDDKPEPARFNVDYLAEFQGASEDLTGKKITPELLQRGNTAAMVDIGVPEFLGVIMPVRSEGFTYPQWIIDWKHPKQAEPEKVAA